MNQEIIEHLKLADPVINQLINRIGKCTLLPRRNEPFDVLVSSIISQQLSEKAATSIKNRLIKSRNLERPFNPKQFCNLEVEALRKCGLSNSKSEFIIALANLVINGDLNFSELEKYDNDLVIEELLKIRGVGIWTAEMFLIFCLGRLDVFALRDAGLKRAISDLYGSRYKNNATELLHLAEKWRPYRSVASWYFWRYLD